MANEQDDTPAPRSALGFALGFALVLGGGGVTGIAWELGVLLGLRDAGVDVSGAQLVVGTSAGANVGAMITSGIALDDLFARQVAPVAGSTERAVDLSTTAIGEAGRAFANSPRLANVSAQDIRRGLGRMAAMAPPAVPQEERRKMIEARLPVHSWPEQHHLVITAVDAQTGDRVAFTRESGVPLVDAVMASGAVPGVYAPVSIGDRRYIDGGAYSNTSADLAVDYARVLILNPLPQLRAGGPWASDATTEAADLERQDSRVLVVVPDENAVQAIGPNVLDPARRAAAAQAGREQGRAIANTVRAMWG